VSLPVAVVMGRRIVTGKRWQVPSWHVVGVVSGAELPARQAQGALIRSDAGEEHFLWDGLKVELFRDAAGSYWANLTGTHPSLWVLCTEDADGRLSPKSVTADQDEAGSAVEVGDRVFSSPIPPDVYQHLEAFVIEHHAPEEKHRRKRKNWSAQDET
jgi:hypothetical protein